MRYRLGEELYEKVGDEMKKVTAEREDIVKASGVPVAEVQVASLAAAVAAGGKGKIGEPAKSEATAKEMIAALEKTLEAKARELRMLAAPKPGEGFGGEGIQRLPEKGKRELANIIQAVALVKHETPLELQTRMRINLDLTSYYDPRKQEHIIEQKDTRGKQSRVVKGGSRKP